MLKEMLVDDTDFFYMYPTLLGQGLSGKLPESIGSLTG